MGARDEFFEEILDRTVAPYRALVAPDVLEMMREMLACTFATHPVVSRLVDRARPRTGIQKSDDYEAGTLEPRGGADSSGDDGSKGRGPA